MNPILATFDLTRSFGDLVAVDAVNLQVARGEIFGLVGPDGAGKTTTMRMLVGVLDPTSGDARVLDAPLAHMDSVRSGIGYMSQRFGLYDDLTVSENMRFFGELQGVTGRDFQERSDRLSRVTGLAPFADRQAGRLSGGMRQKLGLMCALLHRPRILFLDEPTAGVDPVSRREFWRLLYSFVQEGVTIVIATSYMDEAERCGRLAMLYRGRVVALDTPAALRSRGGAVRSLDQVLADLVRPSDA